MSRAVGSETQLHERSPWPIDGGDAFRAIPNQRGEGSRIERDQTS